jgi:F-type H+-transporting ATPase subunit b
MFISIAQAAETAAEHAAPHGFFAGAENWVAITWLIVVAFLAKPIYRGIVAGLDVRREKIKARIEEAERLRSEAQEALATYQKKQRDSLKEAAEIIAHAKAEAERIAVQSAKDLDDLLKRREQQALDRIAQAETEALREVRNTAVDIAIAATRTLIADSLSAEASTALVDQAIQDLPNRLH